MVPRSTVGARAAKAARGGKCVRSPRALGPLPPLPPLAAVLLPNPRRFSTLALPHGLDRAGGADDARERSRRPGLGHSAPGRAFDSLRDAPARRALAVPLGREGDGGGRGGGLAEDRPIEVGRVVPRRAGAASVRGAGAARVAGRARAGPVSVLARAGGGG